MRIFFISHSAGQYGAELALLELLHGLTKLNVQCMVLVPKRGPLLAKLDSMNVEWRIIPYPKWQARSHSFLSFLVRTFVNAIIAIPVAIMLSRWRADIVYTNTSVACVGGLSAWLARKPHVWHLHESFRQKSKHAPGVSEKLAMKLMYYLSKSFIVISSAVRDDFQHYIHESKLNLIYQSVTLPKISQGSTHESSSDTQFFRCVIIASLNPWKGQHEAIQAISQLISKGINIHLLIVGGGKKLYLEVLQQRVIEAGLEHHVKFTGYVDNPCQFFQIADVVLICSQWEPFGRVTIEAMLAGKPIIGTDSGGTAELIQEGKTGLLYKPGYIDELAEKIQYLYENPEIKLTLGATAQVWASNRFTQERYAKQVFDLLFKLKNKH